MLRYALSPRLRLLVFALLFLLVYPACSTAATPTPRPAPTATPPPRAAPAPLPVATLTPTAAPRPVPTPTVTPLPVPKLRLTRLKVGVAPTGFDSNWSWVQSRSSLIDKRPALEFLIGTDPNTGGLIPELAERWEMSPDGRSWTVNLRKGIKFNDRNRDWGEFSAADVRHSVFLLTLPESIQSDVEFWRDVMGIKKEDTVETVAEKVNAGVEVVNPQKLVFHLKTTESEFMVRMSARRELVIQSKAHWDAGGKELYEKKLVGTGPFEFIERKLGERVVYRRVEKHWRVTPEYEELEFRWVPEALTRLATLLAGEVHVSDVERTLQKDAIARGMKVIQAKLPGLQHVWYFGGLYFATPEKLDPQVPFVKKEVRQAMNMAINRKAIADVVFGGRVQPHPVTGILAADEDVWPGLWNPEWEKRFDELYGYNPTKAKALLNAAGYPNGFEFTIYLYTRPGASEIIDIGEAMALDFQAVGLKPKLVQAEFAKVRDLYRTRSVHGAMFSIPGPIFTIENLRSNSHVTRGSNHTYEHPYHQERWDALTRVVAPADRGRLLREMGDHNFFEFASMPLFLVFSEVTVNPKFIADYPFPGSISGFVTHLEYIKVAP